MEMSIMVAGKTIKDKDLEFINTKMGLYIQASL